MNTWIELATVMAELLLAWYFYSSLLGKSESSGIIRLLAASGYFVFLSCLSLFVETSLTRTTAAIVLTYLAVKIYFGKPWTSVLCPTVLHFLFAVISDVLCGTLLQLLGFSIEALMGDGMSRLLYNASGKLLHLICLYVFLTIEKAKFDSRSIVRALPLLFCQLLSIYICFYSFAFSVQGSSPAHIHLETLGLLYINIIICTYLHTLSRTYESERDAQLARQQLEIQRQYYSDVMERQEETRRLWHDIKKYILSIEALAEDGKTDEIRGCFASMFEPFQKNMDTIDTGNTVIDSILSYGMKRAREFGVTLHPDIWIDRDLEYPAADLFVIIGNTLDNAVEACSQLEDQSARHVQLELRQKNHLLLYEIRNPCSAVSIPKPGKLHGYGLKNVRICVERTHGSMSCSEENGIYTVSICLNLGKN